MILFFGNCGLLLSHIRIPIKEYKKIKMFHLTFNSPYFVIEFFQLHFKSPLSYTLHIQWSNQSIKLLPGKAEDYHNIRENHKRKCDLAPIPLPWKNNSPTGQNLNSQRIFFHPGGKTNTYYNLCPYPMDWCVLLSSLFPVQDILSAIWRYTRNLLNK